MRHDGVWHVLLLAVAAAARCCCLCPLLWSFKVRFNIGERLKQVLDLEPSTLIEYKHHQIAMQDMSTFRYDADGGATSTLQVCCPICALLLGADLVSGDYCCLSFTMAKHNN